MAYIEIRKHGKLIKRRPVDDRQARKGCGIRLDSKHVQLRLGESKVVGDYQLTLFEGDMPDSAEVRADGLSERPEEMVTKTSDPLPPAKKGKRPSHVPAIEGYEIVGRIGHGGMGTVWKAVQLSTKRPVAIKLLARHCFSSKKSKARFEREVALAARLTHPNIARVYASGLHHGVYYYAMELIEGEHLDQYVRTHQLSDRDILKLMYHICDAMAHAHGQGIVHRDLKPSNILVSANGQPHIVDFGLAKSSTKDDSDLTISIEGEIAGTIAYMAPEQAMGQQEKITERTDVYGLGVILYQLLTAHLPHAMGGGRYDVLKRIVEDDVTEPSHFNEGIDRELESIILTALGKLPEDRYPSARVLAQDIDNYLKGEPLYARSLSSIYRLKKRLSQQLGKYKMLAVGAVLGCVLLAVGYLVFQFQNGSRQQESTAAQESQTPAVLAVTDDPVVSKGIEIPPLHTNTIEEKGVWFKQYAQKYPLHAAVRTGDMNKLKALLDQGVALDQLDLRKWSALHWATYLGRADVAQKLFSRGVQSKRTYSRDLWDTSIVNLARIHGYVQLTTVASYSESNDIYSAVNKEDFVRMRELLDQDPNLARMGQKEKSITPLHEAAAIGSKAAVSLLIEYGADIQAQTIQEVTPIQHAASWGQEVMVDYLVSCGATKGILCAAALGDIESVRAFLQQDPQAVHIEQGQITPLKWATYCGHADVAELLIEYGADVEDKALALIYWPVKYNHVDTAEVLLEHGITESLDQKTKTHLLGIAAYHGYVDMVKLLCSYNLHVDDKVQGSTPLHAAAFSGDVPTVEYILNHIRDDIYNQNNQGHTPMDIAKQMGYDEIVTFLQGYAAREEHGTPQKMDSSLSDPRGNLQGNPNNAYLDIVQASVRSQGNSYVFSVTMAGDFLSPNQLQPQDAFTIIWFVDSDRNEATGQTKRGNDYNIHLTASKQRGWTKEWYKVTKASRKDGISINFQELAVSVNGNTATLTIPKNYLPTQEFDWYVNAQTRPFTGSHASRNPPSSTATFRMESLHGPT